MRYQSIGGTPTAQTVFFLACDYGSRNRMQNNNQTKHTAFLFSKVINRFVEFIIVKAIYRFIYILSRVSMTTTRVLIGR
jgi:hypothetical protein